MIWWTLCVNIFVSPFWLTQALKDQVMCAAMFHKAMPTPMKTKHKALCALRKRLLEKGYITKDRQGKYVNCQDRILDQQPATQDPDLQPEQDEQEVTPIACKLNDPERVNNEANVERCFRDFNEAKSYACESTGREHPHQFHPKKRGKFTCCHPRCGSSRILTIENATEGQVFRVVGTKDHDHENVARMQRKRVRPAELRKLKIGEKVKGIGRRQAARSIYYHHTKQIGNDLIAWAKAHKEKTADGRRVVDYATLPGGVVVVVMTSDTLEAMQLHPNVRRGISSLDGCFKGFIKGQGSLIQLATLIGPEDSTPHTWQ